MGIFKVSARVKFLGITGEGKFNYTSAGAFSEDIDAVRMARFIIDSTIISLVEIEKCVIAIYTERRIESYIQHLYILKIEDDFDLSDRGFYNVDSGSFLKSKGNYFKNKFDSSSNIIVDINSFGFNYNIKRNISFIGSDETYQIQDVENDLVIDSVDDFETLLKIGLMREGL